jgi:uncharacterized protein
LTVFIFLGEFMAQLLNRFIETELNQVLGKGKVILLTGARRVGKTVLLKKLASLKINPLLLNAEDADVKDILSDRRIANYKTLFEGKDLVVIDEAQSIKEIGLILKLMIDEFPNAPLIASGSSSFNLLNQSGEPLTGRYSKMELFPMSWMELNSQYNALELKQQLDERLIFGSYPELFTQETVQSKRIYLKEMVTSYLLRDILAFDGLRNTKKLLDLLKLVAYQVGNELSYDELGKQLGMSKNTVERYLYILREGYVLFQLGGYSNNLRKEVTKSSKWYFWDNGIRNAIINEFEPLSTRKDIGALWENFCISERIKRSRYLHDEINHYFWRTYDQQEIDLIEEKNSNLAAYEIKWNQKKAKIPGAFAKAYPNATYAVIEKNRIGEWLV